MAKRTIKMWQMLDSIEMVKQASDQFVRVVNHSYENKATRDADRATALGVLSLNLRELNYCVDNLDYLEE